MCAVVLLDTDERWNGKPDIPAYYVHNLGTKPGIKGAIGKKMANIAYGLIAQYIVPY
ncbi:hypothetical protein AKMU_05630 [Akkermansia muciniphila]|jgi:hypothetical protein|nr:hypothetical protein AKMU_05630 [Akkermansia muciniphila]